MTLRHSRGPKKVAEVLDRLHVLGTEREKLAGGRVGGENRLDARSARWMRPGCFLFTVASGVA